MSHSEKIGLVRACIDNYLYYKKMSKVFGREHDSNYLLSQGKLLGVCMAFKLDIDEHKNHIDIRYQSSGRLFFKYYITRS